jgi:hypothetical protein
VRARGTILDPADMHDRAVEVDLVPAEITGLGRSLAVPVGQQDHGGVTVTVPVAPRGLGQRLDLVRGCAARRSSAASEQLFVLLQLARPRAGGILPYETDDPG